ncbi:hypothetical protein DFH06DRAFT_1418932 [Mycena polygramma]|nr:hypothetical protein DFH06DRAFT_1418932 [Mycena polygramma]
MVCFARIRAQRSHDVDWLDYHTYRDDAPLPRSEVRIRTRGEHAKRHCDTATPRAAHVRRALRWHAILRAHAPRLQHATRPGAALKSAVPESRVRRGAGTQRGPNDAKSRAREEYICSCVCAAGVALDPSAPKRRGRMVLDASDANDVQQTRESCLLLACNTATRRAVHVTRLPHVHRAPRHARVYHAHAQFDCACRAVASHSAAAARESDKMSTCSARAALPSSHIATACMPPNTPCTMHHHSRVRATAVVLDNAASHLRRAVLSSP